MTDSRMEMTAAAEAIPATAERIASLGATAGLDRGACFQLQVAVTEALNNIVQHALADAPASPVKIRCRVANGFFEVTTFDRGLPMPALPDREFPPAAAESSRGWPIIFSWVDDIEYHARADGNTLTLRKNLP